MSTMTHTATSLPGRLPRVIPATIAAAWFLTVLAEVTGQAEHLHHDARAAPRSEPPSCSP